MNGYRALEPTYQPALPHHLSSGATALVLAGPVLIAIVIGIAGWARFGADPLRSTLARCVAWIAHRRTVPRDRRRIVTVLLAGGSIASAIAVALVLWGLCAWNT